MISFIAIILITSAFVEGSSEQAWINVLGLGSAGSGTPCCQG